MLRKLRWYRAYLASFIGLLCTLAIPMLAICLLPIAYSVFEYDVAIDFLTRPCALAVVGVSVLIGCARGWIFHPVFDEDYWNWLAQTPWRPGYPLPKGPLDLQWQDLTLVAFLVLVNGLLALTIPSPIWHLILGPFAGYCLGLTVAWSFAVGITRHGRYVLLTLAVPVLFRLVGASTQAFILCPGVMLAVARIGLQRSLADFPWTDIQRQYHVNKDSNLIGWPWNVLTRSVPSIPCSLRFALPFSIVAGGWCWLISTYADSNAVQGSASEIHILVVFATLYAIGARITAFRSTICQRFCMGLRFGRKRWFIPKHDQIFVAPLTMLATSVLLPILLHGLFSIPYAASNGLTAGLVCLVGLAMGPNVRELYYTGEHSKFGGSVSSSDQSRSFISVSGD